MYTILLITLDMTGEVMALIQSGIKPVPRIIIVHTPEALEYSWNQQTKKEIFYDSVYSVKINEELKEKMDKLGIKDGIYFKEDTDHQQEPGYQRMVNRVALLNEYAAEDNVKK